ncbi:RNase adapter RapZ [Streptomyces rimosus]|uniref:RapZ C-terminal domain-containing protein n=1 Tax=Streptomyces rimosus TaxID=1927 RepID=UPI001F435FB3|nr:RNase adapter RapZ [Streptomyces rimosus]
MNRSTTSRSTPTSRQARRIAIGCAGGRHRASGLAELLARALREHGRDVEVEHLHVHLPRVLKAPQ